MEASLYKLKSSNPLKTHNGVFIGMHWFTVLLPCLNQMGWCSRSRVWFFLPSRSFGGLPLKDTAIEGVVGNSFCVVLLEVPNSMCQYHMACHGLPLPHGELKPTSGIEQKDLRFSPLRSRAQWCTFTLSWLSVGFSALSGLLAYSGRHCGHILSWEPWVASQLSSSLDGL